MKLKPLAALPALLATLLLSCEKVDTKGRTPDLPTPLPTTTVSDTVLLLTAISAPEDYDWHRDTAAGASSCELLLYKDMELAAVYRTGPQYFISTDPDTHHLINGHLYTEYVTEAETVIKCDGEELFRYAGREFLVGLLPFGSAVYTLGRLRSGGGYRFRRNGELLLDLPDCRVFGDFGSSAYGRTGAIYRDGGHFCFCYKDISDKCWKVQDESPSKISLPSSALEIIDVKIHDRKEYVFYMGSLYSFLKAPAKTYSLGSLEWSSAGIVIEDGDIYVTGTRKAKEVAGIFHAEDPVSVYMPVTGSGVAFSAPAYFVYHNGAEAYAVIPEGDGFLVEDGDDALFEIPSSYVFTRDCAVATDDGFIIGVNPRAKGGKPYLLCEDEEYIININGYITSVAMEIKR
ncbi:MAG: hypothetical protein J5771_06055 [Bacteroidales bacterium]|nr:hypothetical protein [Bacteroidales bacterium]